MNRSLRPRAAALLVAAALVAVAAAGCIRRQSAAVAAPGTLRIVSLTAEPDSIYLNEQSVITAEVENPEGGELTYAWQAYRGSLIGQGDHALYYGAYCCAGTDWVVLQVRNESGESDTRLVVMTVYPVER